MALSVTSPDPAEEPEEDPRQAREYGEIMKMLSERQSGKRVMDLLEKFVNHVNKQEQTEPEEHDNSGPALAKYWANARKTEIL